jgi:hypothetical protein
MAVDRMSFISCAAYVAAALGALWLAGATPADAAEEQVAQQAREECRELLREQGFRDIDFDDMRLRDEGETVVIEVEAERQGNQQRQLRCVYDVEDEDARLAE